MEDLNLFCSPPDGGIEFFGTPPCKALMCFMDPQVSGPNLFLNASNLIGVLHGSNNRCRSVSSTCSNNCSDICAVAIVSNSASKISV